MESYNPELGSIEIDFIGGAIGYRRKYGNNRKSLLAKAVGIKSGKKPFIFDATAGLGRDSFIFALLGCKVQMAERSPIIADLLEDALEKAAKYQETSEIISRISFFKGDACDWLKNINEDELPDIIYLDPMFPERKKSSLVKKEMRILKNIVGDDNDIDRLFFMSLSKANKRVVVKRPRTAPFLSDKEPSYSLKGKSGRFDIYMSMTQSS